MPSPRLVLLELAVPRLSDRGPLAFEQILASLHGLLTKRITGTERETISIELLRSEGRIRLFIVVPAHLQTLVQSQCYSQYPEVQITRAGEFFVKRLVHQKQILVAALQPSEPYVYPIKRYPQFEDRATQRFEDPLGPITAALTQLYDQSDNALIQFVISPIPPKWNEIANAALKRLSGSGLWTWDAWRSRYNAAVLDPLSGHRATRAPVRWVYNALGGYGPSPSISHSAGADESDDLDRQAQTSGRHDRETVYSAAYDKLTRLHFAVSIRAAYFHSDPDPLHAEAKIREIVGTFQQFAQPGCNRFTLTELARSQSDPLFRALRGRRHAATCALSQEELATLVHLPTETVQTPGMQWVESRTLEPPLDLPGPQHADITLVGQTNFRHVKNKYGILPDDRRRHTYVIGKTGMGKSTLLENMIFSDIRQGRGVGVIDPHGDLAEAVLRFVPKSRTNDIMIFEPSDRDFPIAFNMLEGKNADQRSLIASGLIGVIKKLNIDSWGPRLEHFLRNTILALVEAPDTTMLGITRMLVDNVYRQKILHHVQDPMVKAFWATEFDALSPAKRAEAIGPIQNKVGQFLATPMIRNIVGQPKSTLDLRFAMDTGKIVIVNLSKGKVGEDNATMLGSLLITKFQLDAMSRADTAEADRRDFFLYVDEFQNFATDSFATILSEARKYRLSLTMANQYLAQMSDEVASAVFGNVGSLISFQVGIDDAQVLSEQFDPDRITPIAIASLPKYKVYNRIMVKGLTSPVFSGDTLPPPDTHTTPTEADRRAQKVKNYSRQRYAQPREVVEGKILRWSRSEAQKRQAKSDKTEKKEKTSPSKPPASAAPRKKPNKPSDKAAPAAPKKKKT